MHAFIGRTKLKTVHSAVEIIVFEQEVPFEKLQLSPSELVMVGDGAQDIGCAKAAGAHSVGVEGGMQGSELLLASEPDVLLRSLLELPAALQRWLNP